MNKLSIIIPAFNEEKTVGEAILKVKESDTRPFEKEIIVVDNNSTDKTFQVASAFTGIKVIREQTRGKGAAVRRGFREATGDVLIIQDADMEYDPIDFPALLRPISEGRTEVVLGVRNEFHNGERRGFLHTLGNFAITFVSNVLYGNDAKEYTGGYKVFTKKAVDSVQVHSNDFAYEHELVCKVLKKGYRTVDVPIRYYRRSALEGKKINWKDGFKILWAVIKYRFID